MESNSDTYAIEIKPKQGWLWDTCDIYNLCDKKREEAATTTHDQQQYEMQGLPRASLPSRAPTSCHDKRDDDIKSFSQDIRCRHCSMQLLKVIAINNIVIQGFVFSCPKKKFFLKLNLINFYPNQDSERCANYFCFLLPL